MEHMDQISRVLLPYRERWRRMGLISRDATLQINHHELFIWGATRLQLIDRGQTLRMWVSDLDSLAYALRLMENQLQRTMVSSSTTYPGMVMTRVSEWRPETELWNGQLLDHASDRARARELFKRVAGEEAYNQLAAYKPLLLTGSEGGRYRLYDRLTYCVQRVRDGAMMCAVVPGVPLWDHLLGIKMIIENDEAYFRRVANVEHS